MTWVTSDVDARMARETRSSVALVAVAVNAWAALTLFQYAPSLVLRLTPGEVVGVAAYVLAVALLETLLLSAPIVVIGQGLARLRRPVPLAIAVAGALLGLLVTYVPCAHPWATGLACNPSWPLLLLGMLAAWIGLIAVGVRRRPAWIERISDGLARLVPLAVLYLAADGLAVVVVIGRLIVGGG